MHKSTLSTPTNQSGDGIIWHSNDTCKNKAKIGNIAKYNRVIVLESMNKGIFEVSRIYLQFTENYKETADIIVDKSIAVIWNPSSR
jgi:hypothetical protein